MNPKSWSLERSIPTSELRANRIFGGAILLALILIGASSTAGFAGEPPTWPDQPGVRDPEDDTIHPQGKKDCPPKTSGLGLHVSYANGNVWTEVPILSIEGGGETTLSIALTYNSLLSTVDEGYGLGWSSGIISYGAAVPIRYEIHPEVIHPEPFGGCFFSAGQTCENQQDRDWMSGTKWVLDAPPRVVFIDSDGRRNAYYRYDFPPPTFPPFHQPGSYDDVSQLWTPGGRDAVVTDLVITGEAPPECPDCTFKMEFPDGTVYFFREVDSSGVLDSIRHPRGSRTVFTYDPLNAAHVTQIRDPYGRIVTFDWADPSGQHLSKISYPATGEFTSFAYDVSGTQTLLAHITDPLSKTTDFGYDAQARIISETLKNGRQLICSYDPTPDFHPGQPTRQLTAVNPISDPDVYVTVVAPIDASNGTGGFPTSRWDVVPYPHGSLGATEPVAVRNGNNVEWTYFRNRWGGITSYQDLNVNYQFQAVFDDGSVNTSMPDSYRREKWDGNLFTGLVTAYNWLSQGRIASRIVYPSGTGTDAQNPDNSHVYYKTSYRYKDQSLPGEDQPPYPGLPLERTDPNGAIWKYHYNPQGDIIDIEDPAHQHTSFAYTYYSGDPSLPGRVHTVIETDRRLNHTTWT